MIYPDIASRELLLRRHVRFEHADLVDMIFFTRRHKLHKVTAANRAVDNLVICCDASERIEHRVKYGEPETEPRIALGSRYAGK